MKEIFVTVALLSTLVYFAFDVQVKTSPFRVEFKNIIGGIGWMMVVFGFMMIQYAIYSKGERSGYKKGVNDFANEIKKMKSEN